jgi:hypothetical protein
MNGQQHTGTTPVVGGSSRRLVLQGIAYAGVVTASMVSLSHSARAAQDATPGVTRANGPFTGETFVGPTSDPNTFLAVVVAEAGEAGKRAAKTDVG